MEELTAGVKAQCVMISIPVATSNYRNGGLGKLPPSFRGGCWGWDSMKPTWRNALDAGDVVTVLQAAPVAHPDLPKVPLAISYAKTDEARNLIQAGVHNPATLVRPYSLPPGTPKERVMILRDAFIATMVDPEFVTEAKKSNLEIDPKSGAEVEKIVDDYFRLAPL